MDNTKSQGALNSDIETKQPVLRRFHIPVLILAGLLVMCLIIIGTQIAIHYQMEAKVATSKKLISSLKKEALLAQTNDELDKAEDLYSKAFSEAIDSKLRMAGIELISRIVQIKIKKGQLRQTDDLVQAAMTVAGKIQNTSEADSSLPIWLDDMANAFYSRGENSTREDVKEFCLRRYLDIKLPSEDHFDRFLKGRSDTLTSYLINNGRYLEAVPYCEKYYHWIERASPNDTSVMPAMYEQLGSLYLLAQKTEEADSAYKKFLELNQGYKTLLDKVLANMWFGQLCEQENKLPEAESIYKKAIAECRQCYSEVPNVYRGRCIATLGHLEQKLSHTTEAKQLFQESLDCYDKSEIPKVTPATEFIHPDGWVYSGRVYCIERLSEIALKNGDPGLSQSLKIQATDIRDKNSHWAACKNPDPDYFYMILGYFPFAMETIHTHIKFVPDH